MNKKLIAANIMMAVLSFSPTIGATGHHLQAEADAAWEGLSMEQQQELRDAGVHGDNEYVIKVREGRIFEDEPGWDCNTMGNKICGSAIILELPRTN